jgi:hypothetical protein
MEVDAKKEAAMHMNLQKEANLYLEAYHKVRTGSMSLQLPILDL